MVGGKRLILLAAAALAATPDNAWHRCADADPQTAIAGCSAIIDGGQETGKGLAVAYYNRGIAYRNLSQFARAEQGADPETGLDHAMADYNAALRLKPDYAPALAGRAIVWFDKGQYDRAIDDCTHALRIEPNFTEAINNRALALYRKGEYARAQADFNRTIRLRKNYGNALILRDLPPYGSSAKAADEP
jgi:tetratricopeptide (TPR) repeat protein